MSSPTTIYLVTGASRGIGLAIVKELCARFSSDSIIIIAAVRAPDSPLLAEVSTQYPGVIDAVRYVAGDENNNKTLARYVKEKYGRVDVVVANAGIAKYNGPVSETPISQMREHWEVNALGPLILFQSVFALLKASANPKFIPITSGAASSAFIEAPMFQTCYGSSKAVLNFIAKKIHVENDWIVSFPLAPGVVETDMAKEARDADPTGFVAKLQEDMGVTQDVAGKLLVNIIADSTRATHGGEFINLDGTKLPW